jgi:hypothetical protein
VTTLPISRRDAFTGFSAAAILAGMTVPVIAEPAAGADADLIRLCAEHAANMDAYNRDCSDLEPEDNALWAAYERTRDAISKAVPQTVEGMMAKARAAKAEAREPTGGENPQGCPAADWAWDLVNDLLRLNGRGA